MIRSLVIIACIVAAGSVAAAEEIKKIEVVENTKTSDDTVILIADIEPGDEFSYELLDLVRERLVTSELFKSVEVFANPIEGGMLITIIARDKHSWIIAPTFYNQPGNVGGGLGFAEANLWGENKKLLLYGQIATADSFFLGGYVDPSIAGTRFRWGIDTFLRTEKVTEYATPTEFASGTVPVRTTRMNYLNGGLRVGFTLFREFSFDVRLRAAKVYYGDAELAEGASCADVVDMDRDPTSFMQCEDSGNIPEPGIDGWDISNEYIIALDRRANWYGIRTGTRLRLAYEFAVPKLGSDFEYFYATGSYFHGWRGLLLGGRDNLVWESMIGYGQDLPFQQEYTSGGVGLRGYYNRQFRGDFKVKSQLEYSVPMFTIKSLSFRALAFWDTAYTDFLDKDDDDTFRNYLPDPGSTLGPWKNGVGGGIRIYFRSIVVPLLGWDWAYGIESGEWQTYFAVGLTEL